MRYIAKIALWKDGDGWQAHQIANRIANTIEELLGEINCLQLEMEAGHDGLDYNVDIYRGEILISEFWITGYMRDGIIIDGFKYTIQGGK